MHGVGDLTVEKVKTMLVTVAYSTKEVSIAGDDIHRLMSCPWWWWEEDDERFILATNPWAQRGFVYYH